MTKLIFGALIAGAVQLSGISAQAHERDYDRVTEVDRDPDADVVHYDHHHRYAYTDEYGNVIGEQTAHHDHHYVQPRYRHYRHHHYRHHHWFFSGF